MNEAFITGSRAYGEPRHDSDLDVAVFVAAQTLQQMRCELSSYISDLTPDGQQYPQGSACFRFGKLNLLAFTNEKEFAAWRNATDSLVVRRPVTRDEAVEVIDSFVKAGCGGDEW